MFDKRGKPFKPLDPDEIAKVAHQLCKPMLKEAFQKQGDEQRDIVVKLLMGLARGISTIAAKFMESDPDEFSTHLASYIADEMRQMRALMEEEEDDNARTEESTESLWDA